MRPDDQSPGTDHTHTPTDGTVDPGFTESPTDEESIFVIVEISLPSSHPLATIHHQHLEKREEGHTTIAIHPACTTAERIIIKLNVLHPPSLNLLLPVIMIKYDTTDIPCRTTANDIRNPTDRHIEQKYLSRP